MQPQHRYGLCESWRGPSDRPPPRPLPAEAHERALLRLEKPGREGDAAWFVANAEPSYARIQSCLRSMCPRS